MDPLDSIDAAQATVQAETPGVGLEAAPQAPSGVMDKVGGVVVERLARLIHPDPRVPDNYQESMVAGWVNGHLDEMAEEAKVGQSVALCIDVLTDGDLENLPPAAHLGFSLLKFRWLKKKQAELHPATK